MWGGQGRVQGTEAPLPVVRRKSHVSSLTHFPAWPGALVGRWKERPARGLSLLDAFPSPGLAHTEPPSRGGWGGATS